MAREIRVNSWSARNVLSLSDVKFVIMSLIWSILPWMCIGGGLTFSFLVGGFVFVAVFAFEMSFFDLVFWGPKFNSFIRQSVKTLYLFLIEMAGMTYSIPFCIFATGGESNKNMALFLEMVTLSCFSVAPLLATVHPCGCFACRCAVQAVAALLFVATSDDMFPSSSVGILILAWSLPLIFYYAHTCSLITEIMNKKTCSTSLLGGWSGTHCAIWLCSMTCRPYDVLSRSYDWEDNLF